MTPEASSNTQCGFHFALLNPRIGVSARFEKSNHMEAFWLTVLTSNSFAKFSSNAFVFHSMGQPQLHLFSLTPQTLQILCALFKFLTP